MSEETLMVQGLIESNEILQEEVTKLRNSNRILRTVHSALRKANQSLRGQVELGKFNDDVFERFCQGEFEPNAPAVISEPDATGTSI